MKIKSGKFVVFLLLIIGLLLGTVIANATLINPKHLHELNYPKNEFGQTYGSLLYADSYENEPDLIWAIGVDGTEGYVKSSDLNGEEPKSPEEAAQMPRNRDVEINLYDVDGKTVIGKFILISKPSEKVYEFEGRPQ